MAGYRYSIETGERHFLKFLRFNFILTLPQDERSCQFGRSTAGLIASKDPVPEAGGCFRSYFYTDSTFAKASSFYEAMGRKIEAKGFPDLSAFPKRLCLFDSKDMLNFLTCFCNSKNIDFFFFFKESAL